MPAIEWNDSYLTGVRVIDNDHRMLFLIINMLIRDHESGQRPAFMAETLSALVNYVEVHFAREENYMRQYGYPDVDDHIAEHRSLETSVSALMDIFDSNGDGLDMGKTCEFLGDWLRHHILNRDMKYVPYFQAQNVGDDVETEEVTVNVPLGIGAFIREFAAAIRRGGDIEQSSYAFLAEYFDDED